MSEKRVAWNKGKTGVQKNKYKGKKLPWVGHTTPHSKATKDKISKVKKEKPTRYWLGKKHSKKTKEKIGKGRTGKCCGKNNSAWKGGITPFLQMVRHCFKYRQWRSDIFTRDDFTCQRCGERGCYLEAHHIKEFAKIIEEYQIKTYEEALDCEELWNINNGETLCKKCHNKTKKGRRK